MCVYVFMFIGIYSNIILIEINFVGKHFQLFNLYHNKCLQVESRAKKTN